MPQPQAARGNSAMAQFKPKRWQVEDQCGICSATFSLMHTRHHCRHCGLSVCGKHSKNKVIVPSSLSKVPQRVCDKCYPRCRNAARGLAPPPAAAAAAEPRRLPDDKPRRHTLETQVDRGDYGRRARSPREGSRRTNEDARRDNRTWNGNDDYENPRRHLRREVDKREKRMRSPHAARSPHGRDPRERQSRDKRPSSRDRELHARDLMGGGDPRDRERRHREKENSDKENQRREKEPRERRDPRDRERRDRALHERDLFDKAPRSRSRDSPGQKERRRIPSTEPTRNRKHEQMRSPAPSLGKRLSSKHRGDTTSTCRTTSSTLSNLYAGLNANEDLKTAAAPKRPPRQKKEEEKEKTSAFADSTFSIFSLAGSDHSDSETKANVRAVEKKKAVRRPGKDRANSTNRTSMEKKEHLDFSASSSSVKSFEVSAITHKYLNPPKPAKAAVQKMTLKPMIEEDSEEESCRGPSRRKARPVGYTSERRRDAVPSNQRKRDNKVRGQHPSAAHLVPPFRRDRPVDASFHDTSELLHLRVQGDALSKGRKPSSQNSGVKSSRTSSISDEDGFKETLASLSSDNCFSDDECFSNDEDEALARLIAASNRGKQDLEAKHRAKKLAIAGIDPVSLDAQEKARTTANYKLTQRDQDIMSQMSELEAQVLQYQKELPDLIDMYSEATKRAAKAQHDLQKAKARVARYEKAHAAVARAIRSGRLYMKQQEYMAAILELARATGIERSNATLWYLLAECRLKVSQPAAAEEACMTSLRLQPTGAGVALLGRILHERGRDDEAIECYLSALGRNDESEDEDEL